MTSLYLYVPLHMEYHKQEDGPANLKKTEQIYLEQ